MWPLALPAAAVISTGTDPEAQLPYWQLADRGISIRLVQRLPDQTRGFFQARGFSVEDAELIAQSCVFQTIFKNVSEPSSPGLIEYNLRDWVVHATGGQHGMKTREHWRSVWDARQTPKPAQLAFEWALLPTNQTHQAGDYNWGMSIFGLRPGSVFDLDVTWRYNGQPQRARINGVRCAPDIQVSPAAP